MYHDSLTLNVNDSFWLDDDLVVDDGGGEFALAEEGALLGVPGQLYQFKGTANFTKFTKFYHIIYRQIDLELFRFLTVFYLDPDLHWLTYKNKQRKICLFLKDGFKFIKFY